MKTKWEDFAQRRKITLYHFEGMDYEDYVFWCGQRNVEPVEVTRFPTEGNIVEVEDTPIYEEASPKFTSKELSKYRKSKLLELCAQNSVELKGNETKKVLIEKLLLL